MIEEISSAYYPWLKAGHIVSVIAWMAGMLYLPRLFVYHCDAEIGSPAAEMLKVMERRLLRAIVNPAMVATFIFGALLAVTPGVIDWSAWWVYAKLVLILAMSLLHGLFSRWRRQFAEDLNRRSGTAYRVINEAVTLLMIAIVVLVVVKPA